MLGNEEYRKQLASLSFAEKIKILEKFRDLSLVLAWAGVSPKVTRQDVIPEAKKL
jgi:hypothetical protein